ncbi:SDR family oxidoreductase [Paenibacillus cymbidii]|uniref:SDR family oxidoreductase n=1 Tax=Paenibacillus cymbidii TaxID=1639034 RepID=UPI0010820B99|nr:SDR family oxidoreductase [Paenibacillus cymbidii]
MSNLFDMSNKTVVITGGSGLLGTAMTNGLASLGATVVVADIAEPKHTEAAHHFIACDASSTESIRHMLKEVYERFGRIDVLINGATYGAGYGAQGTVDKMSDEDWFRGVDGALGTTFRCTREVIPYMERQGGGSIVNFASMYGIVSPDPSIYGDSGANNPANYGAGKAGVLQFTRYCAAHYASKGIRVNSVSPGPFPTPAGQEKNPAFVSELNRKTMLKRVGKAEEIVGAVALLASDASSYMTGANISVDGGWTAW